MMIGGIRIFQIINVVSIVNVLSLLVFMESISRGVFRFGLSFSGALFIVTFVVILVKTKRTLQSNGRKIDVVTDQFSPLLGLIMPNLMLGFDILLILLSILQDASLLRVTVVFWVATIPPYVWFVRTVLLAIDGQELLVYKYSGECMKFHGSQVLSVKRIFFGLPHSLRVLRDDGTILSFYFFPQGALFGFVIDSTPIKKLRTLIGVHTSDK